MYQTKEFLYLLDQTTFWCGLVLNGYDNRSTQLQNLGLQKGWNTFIWCSLRHPHRTGVVWSCTGGCAVAFVQWVVTNEIYSQLRLSQISGNLTNPLTKFELKFCTHLYVWDKGIYREMKAETWKYLHPWGKWERQREHGKFMTSFWSSWQAGIKGQSNKISQESQLRLFRLRQMI